MVVVKIVETPERRLHIECLRIHAQRGTRLHLDRKGPNSPDHRVFFPYLPQEMGRLAIVRFLFEGETEGEEKVTIDLMRFQLLKTSHQSPIRVHIAFMYSSQPVRSCARGKDHQGLGPGEGLLEGFDQFDRGQPEGFEKAFHLQPLPTDRREKAEKVVGSVGIRIETDVKGFIPMTNGFPDRLKNLFDPPEDDLCSAGDRFLGADATAAPGALDRTASAHGEMIDGRF